MLIKLIFKYKIEKYTDQYYCIRYNNNYIRFYINKIGLYNAYINKIHYSFNILNSILCYILASIKYNLLNYLVNRSNRKYKDKIRKENIKRIIKSFDK